MSITHMDHLDGCDNCGAQRWQPKVHPDGGGFLECEECGKRCAIPRKLEANLRAAGWPKKAA